MSARAAEAAVAQLAAGASDRERPQAAWTRLATLRQTYPLLARAWLLVAVAWTLAAGVVVGLVVRHEINDAYGLKKLGAEEETVVVFETPHRIHEALSELDVLAPDREIALGRELTKLHEELARGALPEVLEQARGEVAAADLTDCAKDDSNDKGGFKPFAQGEEN